MIHIHMIYECYDFRHGLFFDYLSLTLLSLKAEHKSKLLTGTHGLTHENTHHELDPWIQIYSQWQIPKDSGLIFEEQNTHEYPPWVPLLTS